MNNRRKLLVVLGAGAAPLVSFAQRQPVLTPRIGVLFPSNAAATAHLLERFRQGLRDHGYREGQNIVLEPRYADAKPERLAELAAELVRIKVDVIVAANDQVVQAARQHTSTIPIVMTNSIDPVGTGFAASLARPGGNITGLSIMSPELSGKRLALLKEAVPGVTRVAFLWNPDIGGAALEQKELEAASRRLKVNMKSVELRRTEQVESVLSTVAGEGANGLIAAALNPAIFNERSRMTSAAAKYKLPAIFAFGEYVESGGLMSYGPSLTDNFRRVAGYVATILKGARPGDLPIEQPTKFELVVNMKTAKALGIAISQSVLFRADRVIE